MFFFFVLIRIMQIHRRVVKDFREIAYIVGVGGFVSRSFYFVIPGNATRPGHRDVMLRRERFLFRNVLVLFSPQFYLGVLFVVELTVVLNRMQTHEYN